MSKQLSSTSFKRLVSALKKSKKTVSVVEQCCGGVISSSLMAQPGASSVFYGGSIPYNTRKGKALLLNDDSLHSSLLNPPLNSKKSEAQSYMDSKLDWTAKTSVAFCNELETDFCIAEGGAAGPTFRPETMTSGFCAVSIAARVNGEAKVVEQKLVHSSHANRQVNMRLFANAAADLCIKHVDQESMKEERQAAVASALMLDRATKLRSDEGALKSMEPHAKYVVLRDGNQILVESSTEPAMLNHDQVSSLKGAMEPIFLGVLSNKDKTPVFGIGTDGAFDNEKHGLKFVDTRTSAPLFRPLQNELVLHATALAQWIRRSVHCTQCGTKTTLKDGGTRRQCPECHTQVWPRQDPSIIVVVSSRNGQQVLLARSKRHPPKLYTVLAGFVEAGETFEAAVAREVFEETGIQIDEGSTTYIGSQPWPFPQSCMVGFSAVADHLEQELDVDTNELVDAQWFDRAQVEAATNVPGATMQHDIAEAAMRNDPTLDLLIPPKGVVARKLLDTWLSSGA